MRYCSCASSSYPGPTGRTAFTLIELLVVLVVLALLGSLLGSALAPIQRYAIATCCMGNLRQVGMAALTYAEEWNECLPAEANFGVDDPQRSPAWFCRLPPYIDSERSGARTGIFQCAGFHGHPAEVFTNAMPKSFKMNSYLDADGRPRHYCLGSASDQSELVLFIDAIAKETGMGQWGHAVYSGVDDSRHRGRVNILFCDGHGLGKRATPGNGDWRNAVRWKSSEWR